MATTKTKKGLQFKRRFTKENVSPYDQFEYDYRDSVIKNPNQELFIFKIYCYPNHKNNKTNSSNNS